jgi:hypothetical protein
MNSYPPAVFPTSNDIFSSPNHLVVVQAGSNFGSLPFEISLCNDNSKPVNYLLDAWGKNILVRSIRGVSRIDLRAKY